MCYAQDVMNVKEIRDALGYSRQQMAEKLGVSVAAVIKWEQGTRKPSRLALKQIGRLERKAQKNV